VETNVVFGGVQLPEEAAFMHIFAQSENQLFSCQPLKVLYISNLHQSGENRVAANSAPVKGCESPEKTYDGSGSRR
jgi:hypothetical protein